MAEAVGGGAAAGVSPAADGSAWRVKLYRLGLGGAWEDKGTGFARVQHVVRSLALAFQSSHLARLGTQESQYALVVEQETDKAVLLVHRIVSEELYQHTPGGVSSAAPGRTARSGCCLDAAAPALGRLAAVGPLPRRRPPLCSCAAPPGHSAPLGLLACSPPPPHTAAPCRDHHYVERRGHWLRRCHLFSGGCWRRLCLASQLRRSASAAAHARAGGA